jgi:serine acetyltransferase
LLYRVLNHYKKNKAVSIILLPLAFYYRLMTNKYCIDITTDTRIGAGFKLNHAYGIVINKRTTIGDNVYIAHNVTIGSNGNGFPKIGNNVTIFPGSIIIGDITIGDNVIVGAGSLVVKSIAANTTVGGHPSKILKSPAEDNIIN